MTAAIAGDPPRPAATPPGDNADSAAEPVAPSVSVTDTVLAGLRDAADHAGRLRACVGARALFATAPDDPDRAALLDLDAVVATDIALALCELANRHVLVAAAAAPTGDDSKAAAEAEELSLWLALLFANAAHHDSDALPLAVTTNPDVVATLCAMGRRAQGNPTRQWIATAIANAATVDEASQDAFATREVRAV